MWWEGSSFIFFISRFSDFAQLSRLPGLGACYDESMIAWFSRTQIGVQASQTGLNACLATTPHPANNHGDKSQDLKLVASGGGGAGCN